LLSIDRPSRWQLRASNFSCIEAKFEARNCHLLGLSIDSKFSHIAWLLRIEEKGRYKDLEKVVMQCLEKEPARRPVNAETLSTMLLACDCGEVWGPGAAREWWNQHRPLEHQAD